MSKKYFKTYNFLTAQLILALVTCFVTNLAYGLDIDVTDITAVRIISTEEPLVAQTGYSGFTITFSPNCEFETPETNIKAEAGTLTINLSFLRTNVSTCDSLIQIPSDLAVSIELSNTNGSFAGEVSSLTGSTANGSLSVYDTGVAPISFQADGGSIFVHNANGQINLKTTNGDSFVTGSTGKLKISGTNNDVTVSNFTFLPATKNSIKTTNGDIQVISPKTSATGGKKTGLTVLARAKYYLKFPRDKKFTPSSNNTLYVRNIVKGVKSAQLSLQSGGAVTIK